MLNSLMSFLIFITLTACPVSVSTALAGDQDLRIPAFTAYMLPDPDSARFSEERGITRWTDSTQSVNWYGRFSGPCEVAVKVEMQLPESQMFRFRMIVDDVASEKSVTGKGDAVPIEVDFGTFRIDSEGHQAFSLKALDDNAVASGKISALLLKVADNVEAHFNRKERRNAASVHLSYPVDRETEVEGFYCEATGIEEPVTTYYMACGWHRGYFGMQVNSLTERRIIFSVWDSGDEAVDRKKVNDENRVRLMGKGEGVYSGDFGNEGTGGHSHLKYMWKTGEVQRFFVTAQPVEKVFTVYSGYWFHPEKKEWMLISSWKAPKEGGYMRGLYSFSENFGGSSGHLLRKATFGNQWIRTAKGDWQEVTTASFSHDATGKSDRLDRYMGLEDGQFFLSHGGFLDGYTQYGEKFQRPPIGKPPGDLRLPPIDPAK